jgi:hypothetical protein
MNVPRLAWMSVLLAGQLLYTGQGWAESWQHTVTARASTEYDSNPSMSPTNPGSVWRYLIEPGYALMGMFGQSSLNAGLALQMARSSNKTLSPDRDSPTVYLNWLRPSESGEFGINTRYAETTTRDSGGVDAAGRVPESSTRASRSLSGNWRKELSEQSSLSADTAYEKVTYKGGGAYTDYATRSGGLRFSYNMSEQITSFIRVSGNKYMPANGGASSTLTDATLGLSRRAEYLDWTVQAGKSRVAGGSSSTQGSVEAHYTGQQTQLTLNAGRSITPSGLGGYVKSDSVRGSWSYVLSEYSNTGIDLERRNNPSTATGSSSTSSSSSTVWISHNLTSLWSMRTYYQHRNNQGGGGVSASSNLLGLSLAYLNSNF